MLRPLHGSLQGDLHLSCYLTPAGSLELLLLGRTDGQKIELDISLFMIVQSVVVFLLFFLITFFFTIYRKMKDWLETFYFMTLSCHLFLLVFFSLFPLQCFPSNSFYLFPFCFLFFFLLLIRFWQSAVFRIILLIYFLLSGFWHHLVCASGCEPKCLERWHHYIVKC